MPDVNQLSPSLNSAAGAVSPQLASIQQAHELAKAQFNKTQEVSQNLALVRNELMQLSKLGDNVTTEDVIKGAGKLVAAGMNPVDMASLLADMPTNGGAALAGWVQQHAQAAEANDMKVAPAHAVARHNMGVTGLRLLAAHAMNGHTIVPPPSMANELNSSANANGGEANAT